MNDHLTANSHPLRLSEKTLHLYLLNTPTSYPRTLISHKTLCINTIDEEMAFPTNISYGFTAMGSLLLLRWRMSTSDRKAKIRGKHSQNFTYQAQVGMDVYQLSNTQVLVLKSNKISYQ